MKERKSIIIGLFAISYCLLHLSSGMAAHPSANQPSKAWLAIRAPQMTSQDTLEVRVWDDYVFDKSINPHRLYTAVNEEGSYYIAIDSLVGLSRMSLTLSYQKKKGIPNYAILEDYLIVPGDSVCITMSARQGVMQPSGGYDGGEPIMLENWVCRFAGRGSEKYRVRFAMDELTGKISRKEMGVNPYPMSESHLRVKWDFDRCDSLMAVELAYLHSIGEEIPRAIEQQLKADAVGKFNYEKARIVKDFLLLSGQTADQLAFVTELAKERLFFSEEGYGSDFLGYAANSPSFIQYMRINYEIEHRFAKGSYDLTSMFGWINSELKHQRLKDRVLADLMVFRFDTSPSAELWLLARATVRDPFCLAWLEKLGKILPGKEMPDFSLPDLDGRYHTRDEFAGKVLFVDFWYSGCIPCRRYMRDVVGPLANEFRGEERVRFLTVSTDEREVLMRTLEEADFIPQNSIKLYTDGLRFDHPLIKYFGIVAYPAPILVGRNGRILASGKYLKSKDALERLIRQAIDD